jgi:pimeloyl-ACP methyl ester carboxylesterase
MGASAVNLLQSLHIHYRDNGRVWYWLVLMMGAIVVALHGCLLALEDRLLMQPDRCRDYMFYPPRPESRWHRLPSGGLVVTLDRSNSSSSGDDESGEGREVLFCHGNKGNLDSFEGMARRLTDRGYRVRLLEYGGFGAAPFQGTPSGESVVQDTKEAWELCIRDPTRAILVGFSLGGGAATQLLNALPESRMPAQVVLINTFFSLPQLVREKFPLSNLLVEIIKTRWCAAPGLARFAAHHASRRSKDRGWARTVVVATDDDALMHPRHAHQLHAAALPLATPEAAELIWLPSGGHGNGPAIHWPLWTHALAPSL